MKVEFIQSAYGGGFPAPNSAGFQHGESVYVISKDEYNQLLEALKKAERFLERVGYVTAADEIRTAIAKAEGK